MYSTEHLQDLNEAMDFDHVIEVLPYGNVVDAPIHIYAPDLVDDEISDGRWRLLNGFSGQYSYSGPMMHSSEFVGGGLERHIRSNPGYYVTLVNYLSDEEEPTEWAVAFRPLD